MINHWDDHDQPLGDKPLMIMINHWVINHWDHHDEPLGDKPLGL